MFGQRILVPVDLERNSFDALLFVKALSEEIQVQATLLYVLNLNVLILDRRVYRELECEHTMRLRKLAGLFFDAATMPNALVRIGNPREEIVATAEAEETELIILSSTKTPRKKWRFRPATTEHVIRNAPCLTLALPRAWRITPAQYLRASRPANGHADRSFDAQMQMCAN